MAEQKAKAAVLAAVKGMNDILPPSVPRTDRLPDSALWQWFETTVRSVLGRYGYQYLLTPIVEPTALFVRGLDVLDQLLDKAAASGIDEATLFEARLAPDMRPFPDQIRMAAFGPRGALGRLTGGDWPKTDDSEASLADLKATVAMMKPGVQNPHMSASCSTNACWTGCSFPPSARPSTSASSPASGRSWETSTRAGRSPAPRPRLPPGTRNPRIPRRLGPSSTHVALGPRGLPDHLRLRLSFRPARKDAPWTPPPTSSTSSSPSRAS